MKSPEEYLEEEINKLHDSGQPWYDEGIYDGTASPILAAIKQACYDGYMQALNDYENKILELVHPMVNKTVGDIALDEIRLEYNKKIING